MPRNDTPEEEKKASQAALCGDGWRLGMRFQNSMAARIVDELGQSLVRRMA